MTLRDHLLRHFNVELSTSTDQRLGLFDVSHILHQRAQHGAFLD